MEDKIKDLVTEYRTVRDKLDRIKAEQSEQQAKADQLEAELIEIMTEQEMVKTSHYEGVGFVGLEAPKVRASLPSDEEAKEQALAYIKEKGYEDIIKLTVHPSTYASFVAQMIEAGESLPEIIKYFLQPKVKLYRR